MNHKFWSRLNLLLGVANVIIGLLPPITPINFIVATGNFTIAILFWRKD